MTQPRIGAIFPQTEIGHDAGAVRAYAAGVADLGYTHVLVYDHVLGADPAVHTGWDGPYDVSATFLEPMVLLGHLAALTSLELVTAVVILPQRPTALVAKQAATVDVLCGGRFRLGVGLGWNRVEYDALGQSFADRGRRMNEQIPLLRRLWTESSLSAEVAHDRDGRSQSERIVGAGLAPLPVQRPIPVWVGAGSPPACRRVGRLADGWFPAGGLPPGPRLEEAQAIVAVAATESGRDPTAIGMEGRVNWGAGGLEQLLHDAALWNDAGATHVSVNTMRADLATVDEHLAVLAHVAEGLDLH